MHKKKMEKERQWRVGKMVNQFLKRRELSVKWETPVSREGSLFFIISRIVQVRGKYCERARVFRQGGYSCLMCGAYESCQGGGAGDVA